jgi:hypothetical protein
MTIGSHMFLRARPGRRHLTTVVAAALALTLAPVASASQPASPAKRHYARIGRVCAPPAPGAAACAALVRTPVSESSAATTTYTVDDGASSSGPAGGLTPAQLASAYDFEATGGGHGQTVAIVDAYDDPKIESDLEAFDSHYGIAPCTSANGCFEEVRETGTKADTSGWSVETTLDVETVHSVCPKCKILLVEAAAPTYVDLARAVNTAVAKGATEVSNSYSGAEIELGATERAAYEHSGVAIVAATGDQGYDDWDLVNEEVGASEMPDAPASLPSVVAVGGTSLALNANGTRAGESVWNNNGPGDDVGLLEEWPEGATGGGCSTLFRAPLWQQATAGFAATGCGSKRLAGDVSAVADPDTGFDIFDTYNCGQECKRFGIGSGSGWITLGGTSLATPLVSALYGLAGGSGGVRDPALTLYGRLAQHTGLFDVTEGANGFCGGQSLTLCDKPTAPNSRFGHVDCEGTTACNAAPGFDGPSGVGAPAGLEAFRPLFPSASIQAPATLTAGTPASFDAAASSDPYPGGSIASYAWSWGDGTAHGAGVAPSHTFAHAGTYTVTLSVTDNYGLVSTTVSQPVTVAQSQLEKEAEKEPEKKPEGEPSESTTGKSGQSTSGGDESTSGPGASSGGGQAPLNANLQEVAAYRAVKASPSWALAVSAGGLRAGRSGVVAVTVTCPAAAVGECAGTLTLRTLDAVVASTRPRASILTLGSMPFSVPTGRRRTVTVHLSPAARALLARSHPLRVRVIALAHDANGAAHTTTATVTLRLARST